MRTGRKRLLAIAGVVAVAVAAMAVGSTLLIGSCASLNAPEADPNSKVGGPKPPKEVPRPPASGLSFRGETAASVPSFWCKIIRGTGFCRGEEGLPLPPEDATLEAPSGAVLSFRFGGPGVPRRGPGWRVPGNAPLYAGAERVTEGTETRPGPGGARLVEAGAPQERPLGDVEARRADGGDGERFLVEAALPPGEYVVRLVARNPGLEAYYHFRVRLTGPAGGGGTPAGGERGAPR